MKRSSLSWMLTFLRLALCAAALAYLVFNVEWHDHARLADATGARVRVLAEGDATLRVLRDGQPVELALDQFVRAPGSSEPLIERGIPSVVQRMSWRKALLAILLFLPVPFLQSVRLVWMLAIQDVRLSLWNSIKLSFAGNFFNFALPGTVGGDLIKAWYITSFTHHKTEAVTTVFLDRVVGLLGLMFLASFMFVLSLNQIQWPPDRFGPIASGLALVWIGLIAGSIVVFSARLRAFFGLGKLASKLPGGTQLLRIGRATVKMRQHSGLLMASLGNTLVLQLLVVISAFVMARACGLDGTFLLYFICVPIGFLIAAIPIAPPQAFGVMEAAYIQFFVHEGLHNTSSQAVAFALAVRLIQLVWALPGVLVPLLGAHVPSSGELAELDQPEPGETEESRADAPPVEPRATGLLHDAADGRV